MGCGRRSLNRFNVALSSLLSSLSDVASTVATQEASACLDAADPVLVKDTPFMLVCVTMRLQMCVRAPLL